MGCERCSLYYFHYNSCLKNWLMVYFFLLMIFAKKNKMVALFPSGFMALSVSTYCEMKHRDFIIKIFKKKNQLTENNNAVGNAVSNSGFANLSVCS